MLSVVMLSVIYTEMSFLNCYAWCSNAESHHAECLYAECRYAEGRGASLLAKCINFKLHL